MQATARQCSRFCRFWKILAVLGVNRLVDAAQPATVVLGWTELSQTLEAMLLNSDEQVFSVAVHYNHLTRRR